MRVTTLLQRVIKILGISALTVLLFACADVLDEINIGKQQDKATVSFSVTDTALTVLPQASLANAASFKLLGGRNSAAETVLVESFTGTGTSVALDPGTWNFTLNAYNNSGEHILQGKVQNKQINLTGSNQVSFSLSVIKSGTGSIQITLNFPTTAGITKISVNGDVTSENFTSITNGSFVYSKNGVAAEDYFINFELYSGVTLQSVVSELVVVRSGLVSSKTITLVGDDLKPVLTGTVSITGAVLVDETLAADVSALNGTGAISYQWKRGNTNVGTDTGTYKVQATDVGGTITVTVTRNNYIGEITSSPTTAVPALVSVTLNNVTQDGSSASQTTTLLTLNFGSSIPNLTADNITISHSVSGQDVVKGVPTASGNNYTLPISGFTSDGTLTVSVAKPGYNITGSPKTISVYCYTPPLTGTVGINGKLVTNQQLSANTTNLGGNGAITYQWRRGTTAVGTNSSTYAVVAADVSSSFTLRVTRAGYSGYIDSLPLISGSVSITGTAQIGQTLTASTTSLGGSGDITYQWKRGSDVIGTNSSTYTIQSADEGSTITVTVTRAGYTGSVTSSPTATITLPALSGSVSITGTAQKGQTLSVSTSSLGGSGTISYQWNRGGTAISGATNSTYILQLVDVSSTITVTVTRAGYSGSVTSAATEIVIGSANETQIFLLFSTTVESSITTTNTTNRYVVTLAQQGTLVLSLTSPGGTGSLPNKGADVKWYNSSYTLISGGTSSGFTFPYNETKSDMAIGTYYIEIVGRSGAGNTGKYNICVDYTKNEVEPNNTTANAQLLVSGLTINGSITSSDALDMFKYVLTEPGRLTVYAKRGTNNDFYVRWYKPDGTQIKYQEVYANDYSDYTDLEKGTYYIGIAQYGSTTGTYTLRGDFVAAENNEATATTEPSNNTLATAQLLTSGQTVKGFISYQDSIDMYKYVLTAPGRLTMIATRETNRDFYIKWYKPDGTQIKYQEVYANDYSDYTDFEAGTYYIGIEQYGSVTGTYTLKGNFVAAENNETEPNNTRQTAQELTSGQTVKGFISYYQDDIDMYRYVLTAPGRLTLTATRVTNNDFYVRWYNEDGTQIKYQEVYANDYSDYTDFEAGTYYIGIEKYGSVTGTYTLKGEFVAAGNNEIEPNSTRQTAQLLSTSGQTIKGFISYQDGIDMYRVVLSSQRSLTVVATRDTNKDFYVRWYNEDGTQIKSQEVYNNDYNQSDTLAAGTYYIGIEKYGSVTGTYTLKVTW